MAVRKLIILIFILSIFPPPANAYDFHYENIWIFKGMYELGSGERAELEGFSVKVHTVDMNNSKPSAILLIYLNKEFKESFYVDAAANSEQVYNDELKIKVLDINEGIVSLETYRQRYEQVWITNMPKTSLGVGDSVEDSGYTIKVKDVTEEGAMIVVESEEGSVEDKYLSGNHRKFSDEFMLHVVYVGKKNREVFIETLKPGAPEIQIEVLTDKSSYDSGEIIEYQLMLTNNGTVPLHGLILTTSSPGGDVKEVKIQHSGLDPTKTKKFIIPASAPVTPAAKNVNIISEVIGYDYKGNQYSGSEQIEVLVEPYISVEKKIEKLEKLAIDNDFGTDEYFRIDISLENTANFPTAVTVIDENDPSLIPYDLENTEWAVLVEAGSSKEITYYAKPTIPGNFTFESTVAQWKDSGKTYTINSNPVEEVFQVHGSRVTVEKYLSPNYALPGEEIEVTINMVNIGDREVEVLLSDNIPEQFTQVSGKNNWEGELDAGESKEMKYILVTEDTGKLKLPSATIDFIDEKGQRGSSFSEEPVFYVDDMTGSEYPEESPYEETTYKETQVVHTDPGLDFQKPEISRVEAAGFMASSFVTLFCLLSILPVIAYLYINRIYK
ncbi:hypothetical protein V7O62_09770 [Methanolobus sp. ZRKC2]|uniref:hypothetical protein n=1 Tax=Methanolobus sp. ZRKC2 TaxID=3125783 RepID=UPI0032465590